MAYLLHNSLDGFQECKKQITILQKLIKIVDTLILQVFIFPEGPCHQNLYFRLKILESKKKRVMEKL